MIAVLILVVVVVVVVVVVAVDAHVSDSSPRAAKANLVRMILKLSSTVGSYLPTYQPTLNQSTQIPNYLPTYQPINHLSYQAYLV